MSDKDKMKWEHDARRREWICEHGVGHGLHIHGCDGCCSRDDFPGHGSAA